jgi:hypothetical protein
MLAVPARSALMALVFLGGTLSCAPARAPAPASAENASSGSSLTSPREERVPSRDTAGPAQTTPESPRSEAIRVRVEQVGQSPRRALRQRFASGAQQVQLIRAETRIVTRGAAQSLILEGRRTAKILDVTSDGTARFRVEVGPLTLTSTEEHVEDSGESTAAASAQASSSGEVDSCGVWLNHRVDVDAAEPGALALTAEALAQPPDPLPPEEVGSGAVWVATRARPDGGNRVERTTTYELLEAGDSAFRARAVRTERRADGREPATESRGEVFHQMDWLFPDEDLEQHSVATTPDGERVEIRSRMQLQTQ